MDRSWRKLGIRIAMMYKQGAAVHCLPYAVIQDTNGAVSRETSTVS